MKEKIASMLSSEGLDYSNSDINSNALLIYLGKNQNKNEQFVELQIVEQQLPSNVQNNVSFDSGPSYFSLQFQSVLPFEVYPLASSDLALAINFINANLELPGFEYDEANSIVRFRYIHFTNEAISETIIKSSVIGILGVIMMTLDLFSELLEKVAHGEMSYLKILEEILETSQLNMKTS